LPRLPALTVRIVGITTRIVAYDLREAHPDGAVPEGMFEPVYPIPLVTLHTDEGVDGHTMQYGGLGEGRSIGHLLHEAYAGDVIGRDPRDVERIWQDLRRKNRHMYNVADATVGAIDIALWDLRGKMLGQPVAALLGLARTHVPCYATARSLAPTPEQVYEEAKLRKAEGFRGFKVQFWQGLDVDVPRFQAAREGVGPDFRLMQDAAGEYSYREALTAGRVLESLGYHWFEEPIPDRELDQLRRLTDELAIPILAMETLRLHEMPEHLRRGAADIARGDVLIKAGITGLRKACAMAELFGYDLEIHGLGAGLLDVANLHVAASVENCQFVEAHDPLFEHGLAGRPLAIDADGCRVLPDGPGLGVELDWDWIDDHTLEVVRSPGGPS
jgi:L-alanine-DL-glutamate epimerase-like enolase superfamily enzyme